jgi:hypothetical protein
MLLTAAIVLLSAVSGFTVYRLGRGRRNGARSNPALVRAGTLLAYCWLALSALLFAWAAARLLT